MMALRNPFILLSTWSVCFALLVKAGFIDKDTPEDFHSVVSFEDQRVYELVFSDEFNEDGRLFYDGYDPKWTVVHKDDYTNAALQFYHKDNVQTSDGFLNITSDRVDTTFQAFSDKNGSWYPLTKNYRSGMVQGWNKFCFTGGIVEISAELPGDADIGGLWPAMWILGNLARATFTGTSDNVWPWSYDECDPKRIRQQAFSACNNYNHWGFKKHQGRGAPEIDILEVMPGKEDLPKTTTKKPYLSSSFQVSPGLDNIYRPKVGSYPVEGYWYGPGGFLYGENSTLNIFFYGETLISRKSSDQNYLADALSANTNIGETHFHKQHTYRLEWIPGRGGYLRWYLDNYLVYGINQNALVNGGIIPEEPSYLIFNTAISSMWGFPAPCPDTCGCDCWDCKDADCLCAIPKNMCQNLPAHFLIDYVRVYQAPDDEKQWVGCNSEDFPMMRYVEHNRHLFTEKGSHQPLLPIAKGGAKCDGDYDCGYGNCTSSGKCSCLPGFVGPDCLAQDAFFDETYDEWACEWAVYGPQIWQGEFSTIMIAAGIVLLVLIVVRITETKKTRRYTAS
mmetsp:Transcript_5236/g.7239  ORF Transcript_5236/g.7239 Transcript_5236/m.7239 type:complete len:562 (+) Transcript_5236:68-1753(+)